jgi:NADPH:quinone reductase
MKSRAAQIVDGQSDVVIRELDLAEPAADEVLVRMIAAGVNPLDTYVAKGQVAGDAPRPRTLGTEGVGMTASGPVVIRGAGLGTSRAGVWATHVVVPRKATVPVPDGVKLRAAAAVGVAGVAAWRAVTQKAKVGPDDRVLVLGASGGVGSVILSLLRGIGATSWGQTSHEAKKSWIEGLGAERVIVGDAAAVAEQAKAFAPTVVLDPLAGDYFAAAASVLADRGRIVLYGASSKPSAQVDLQSLYRKGATVYGDAGRVYSDEDAAHHLQATLDALKNGQLEIAIGEQVDLGNVNEALAALSERKGVGKILLILEE